MSIVVVERIPVRLARLVGLFDELVAELAEHLARLRVLRVDGERLLEHARRGLALELLDEQLGNLDHLRHGGLRSTCLEQDVAKHRVGFQRLRRDLEADAQRFDRLRQHPRIAKRRGVGQDARDLRVRTGRRRRLVHLFGDFEAAVEHDVVFGPAGSRLEAAAELERLLFDLALADVFVRGGGLAVGLRIPPGGYRRQARLLGGRGRHRRPGREALHALVVGRELHELRDELVEHVHLARVARDARHLLLHFDRLRGLPDLRERAGQEPERVEIARVGLKADLQLRQRLHPVARGALREVELGRGARVREVGLVMEKPLENLERVFTAAQFDELAGCDGELEHRPVGIFRSRQRLGQPQVRQRVGRVEVDDLAEHLDGFLIAILALEARRDLVEGGQRVARETELLIELGELRRDVRVLVFERRDVPPDDLADLLVDGDRLEREALLRVELPHALVGRDGRGVALHLELEIAHLQESPCVVRIFLDDPLVLDHRLVVLLLLDVLLGGGEHLFAVNRHDSECSSDSGTAMEWGAGGVSIDFIEARARRSLAARMRGHTKRHGEATTGRKERIAKNGQIQSRGRPS